MIVTKGKNVRTALSVKSSKYEIENLIKILFFFNIRNQEELPII